MTEQGKERPPFTPRAFTLVVAKVMLACVVLLALVISFLIATDGPDAVAAPTIAPAGYLCFLLGWAVAYTQFFRFPERQKVLLLGVAIGGVLLGATNLLTATVAPQPADARFNPLGLIGGFIGCAMQLYVLVFVLRFLPFLRPRI